MVISPLEVLNSQFITFPPHTGQRMWVVLRTSTWFTIFFTRVTLIKSPLNLPPPMSPFQCHSQMDGACLSQMNSPPSHHLPLQVGQLEILTRSDLLPLIVSQIVFLSSLAWSRLKRQRVFSDQKVLSTWWPDYNWPMNCNYSTVA